MRRDMTEHTRMSDVRTTTSMRRVVPMALGALALWGCYDWEDNTRRVKYEACDNTVTTCLVGTCFHIPSEVYGGSQCTMSCHSDAECGKNAQCLIGDQGFALCYQECNPGCGLGMECRSIKVSGAPVDLCIPIEFGTR